jgi:hypothetical protein
MSNWEGTLSISDSTVSDNSATGHAGGGIWNGGTLTVTNSIVSGNTAFSGGGGLFNFLGSATVEATIFDDNSAGWGGGIMVYPGDPEIESTVTVHASTISDNEAVELGGGMVNLTGTLTVTASALLANTAGEDGDALYSVVDIENATSLNGSCIVGNGEVAVFNEFSSSQDATGNWWGDPSGPSGAGPGSGDSVGENFDFTGWLSAPPPAGCGVRSRAFLPAVIAAGP